MHQNLPLLYIHSQQECSRVLKVLGYYFAQGNDVGKLFFSKEPGFVLFYSLDIQFHELDGGNMLVFPQKTGDICSITKPKIDGS